MKIGPSDRERRRSNIDRVGILKIYDVEFAGTYRRTFDINDPWVFYRDLRIELAGRLVVPLEKIGLSFALIGGSQSYDRITVYLLK